MHNSKSFDMQVIKFASHRAREKAEGRLHDDYKDAWEIRGVYGAYEVTETDYYRVKDIKGVVRAVDKSDPLPTPCIL